MELEILRAINSWAASNAVASPTFYLLTREAVKNLLPMVILWVLWFSSDTDTRRAVRETLVSTLLLALVAIGIARLLANQLPFRARPLHVPDAQVVLMDWMSAGHLEDMSAFPSDHAVLFFALAVGLFHASRLGGTIAILHATFIVCFTRVAVGLHWPSDVIAGAMIGAATSFLLFKPVYAAVQRSGMVPFFEAREALGYPLLFLATFEIARMCNTVRQITVLVFD